jgi:hypothetical protein
MMLDRDQRLRKANNIDPWDGFRPPPNDTIISQPKIGVTPLQLPINDSKEEDGSDYAGFPLFGSIEAAAKLLSKRPWTEWVWERYALKTSQDKKLDCCSYWKRPRPDGSPKHVNEAILDHFPRNAWPHFISARRRCFSGVSLILEGTVLFWN